MSQQDKNLESRRGFLKKLGLAGTAAGAVAVASNAQAMVADEKQEETPVESSGYQKTEHVRSYYDTLRK